MTAHENGTQHRRPWADLALGGAGYLSRLWSSLAPRRRTARHLPAREPQPGGLRNAPAALGSPDRFRVSDLDGWDEAALRGIIADKLPGTEVLIVSNREPYVHSATPDGIRCAMPAGGLVSALEPIARGCRSTWIAHGSGSGDRETVDGSDRLRVPPGRRSYVLRRVWLSPEEERGYYLGFSNESLWPLCHNAFVRPIFRAEDWRHYAAVNERFADAVIEEAQSDAPVVIVQDYHFALLPRMIRDRLPKATIVTFWHIPWPNAELFGICPYSAEILDGILGSDIVGFQIPLYRMNFADCVERTLESRTNREDWSIRYGGLMSRVRIYPISIAWPDRDEADDTASPAPRELTELTGNAKLALAVGRLDYTKGIPECLRAFGRFLDTHAEWRGRINLLCVASPSRGEIGAYRELHATCKRLAEEINARHGTAKHQPVVFADRNFDRDELRHCYRAADICIVPSLHDGMNLVAKEFVAHRDAEDGVLILSQFAGAIHELPEALKVNPFDIAQMAETLTFALGLPRAQQRERMRRMRETVRNDNIYRWAARLLVDAARYRGHNRLAAMGPAARTRPRFPLPKTASPERSDAEPADT